MIQTHKFIAINFTYIRQQIYVFAQPEYGMGMRMWVKLRQRKLFNDVLLIHEGVMCMMYGTDEDEVLSTIGCLM